MTVSSAPEFRSATPRASESRPDQLVLVAAIAWLLTAAIIAFLAYQQWSFGSTFGLAGLQETGALNGLSAVITTFLGARLLRNPTRKALTWSSVWAAINVGYGVLQLVDGGVGDLFVVALAGSGIAGIVSFVAREGVAA